MNVPNKLTLSRLIFTPLAFFLFLYSTLKMSSTVDWIDNKLALVLSIGSLVMMIGMELSDLIDGKIARKHHLVTDLGKVFDPFSDMFMHLTLFVAFMLSGFMPFVAFIIIMWREVLMLFMRLLLQGQSVSFPANIFGKSKTMLYAITTFLTLILNILDKVVKNAEFINIAMLVLRILFYLCAFASLMSFVIYMVNINKSKVLDNISK